MWPWCDGRQLIAPHIFGLSLVAPHGGPTFGGLGWGVAIFRWLLHLEVSLVGRAFPVGAWLWLVGCPCMCVAHVSGCWGLRFGVGLGWVQHQLGEALVAAPGWGALIELPHSGSPERLLI